MSGASQQAPAAEPNRAGRRVAILLSYSGDGGVERMLNQLMRAMLAAGCAVDLLVLKARGGHFAGVPAGVRVLRLDSGHARLAVRHIARYLRAEQPPVLLAAKDRAGRAALQARDRAGVRTRVFIRLGNTLSESLVGRGRLRRWLRYAAIRRTWPRADGIIAVSHGVAEDVVATSGVAPERVHVLANPVVTPELFERAAAAPEHEWPQIAGEPVIVGAGRLDRQKDFPTLLRAFARLNAQTPAHLVILGEGEDRGALERLAVELGVGERVRLPGFVANPHATMARADLFVLSSAWEGSPNVLTEALALGVPVVATDCRSGPREILAGGRVAPLVPVGDDAAMAAAMAEVLRAPPASATLQAAVGDYECDRATARYLQVLGVADVLESSPE